MDFWGWALIILTCIFINSVVVSAPQQEISGDKVTEAFIVSFFGTLGGLLGALLIKDSFFATAFFSGIGGILGFVVLVYIKHALRFKANYFQALRLSASIRTEIIVALIATSIALIISVFLYPWLYRFLEESVRRFAIWSLCLIISGAAISTIINGLISDKKPYDPKEKWWSFISVFFLFAVSILMFLFVAGLALRILFFLISLTTIEITSANESIFDNNIFVNVFIIISIIVLFYFNRILLTKD